MFVAARDLFFFRLIPLPQMMLAYLTADKSV